jgi:hypothetical protein
MTAAPVPLEPPALVGVNELPHWLLVVVPEQSDPYEKRPPVVIKVFQARHTSTTCRIGIRQANVRAEAVLSPAQLRDLLNDRADLIDPDGDES